MTAAPAAPAIRRADQRMIGPFAFCGGQAALLAGQGPGNGSGDLQLIIYDDAWPEGAAGSLARPSLTRFVNHSTLAELDMIRAAMMCALAGVA